MQAVLGGKERRLIKKYAFEMAFRVQGLGCIPHLKMQASGSNIYSIPPDWKLECQATPWQTWPFLGVLFHVYLAENLILRKAEGKRENDEVESECGNAWDMQPLKRQAFLIVSLSFHFPFPNKNIHLYNIYIFSDCTMLLVTKPRTTI